MPEVLAHGEPDPDPKPRRHRPQEVAGGEEAALIEQAVGGQEQLAVDVDDPAVLEQGGGDEQAVVGRLLDERHDRRQPHGLRGERGQGGVVQANGHLAGQVLEQVPGQPQLGEDDQAGPPVRASPSSSR